MDEAIQGWPYEPEPGEVIAREVQARDGRTVIQIRIELGVLQLEVSGRPDGSRPHGFATYLEYLRYRASASSSAPGRGHSSIGGGGASSIWRMSREHCNEADREFVQFYHRRVAWLALMRYDRALRDADHTLALMDFVAEHGFDDDYVVSHERFRGLVLFHRSQAAAALALERRRPEEAIDIVREAGAQLARHQDDWFADRDPDESPDLSLIEQLQILEREIRKNFAVKKTLREQLDEAVAREDYERAAWLRDQIRARTRR
jgi:hypothetical protein